MQNEVYDRLNIYAEEAAPRLSADQEKIDIMNHPYSALPDSALWRKAIAVLDAGRLPIAELC